jgi:hypothetical protein
MSIAVTSLVRFLADYTFSRTETFSKDFANSIILCGTTVNAAQAFQFAAAIRKPP